MTNHFLTVKLLIRLFISELSFPVWLCVVVEGRDGWWLMAGW